MARPAARQMELAEERDGLLAASLLQLVSYFTAQMQGAEQMRNQLILLAHDYGARPKDLSSASDLTATRIHQIVKEMKERPSLATEAAWGQARKMLEQQGYEVAEHIRPTGSVRRREK